MELHACGKWHICVSVFKFVWNETLVLEAVVKIVMHSREIELISSFMQRSDHYFEYGIGGSTLLAAQTVGKSVTAIDSDPHWIAQVKENITMTKPKVSLLHVDIGKTGNWGTPIGTKSRDRFPSYSMSIRQANVDEIDLCLIDGRFRVSSFLEALGVLHSDAVIAFHDYAARPHYHVVEKFARPIASCEQLCFFVARQGVSKSEIAKMADSYRFNFE